MKKIILTLIVLLGMIQTAFATAVVNVYCWSNYISDEVIQQFEQETGIEVHMTNYDSNETMYAKLKADPNIGYDVVVPSSYYVNRMIKEKMLKPLDKTPLSNISNLNPRLLNQIFDPGNQYSLPFFWGTTGIVVNKKYWDPKTIQHWSDLWEPRFKNQLLMLDDIREVFAMAMITLGHSINTQNPADIQQAYDKLRKMMPNVKLFNSDAIANLYIDEDVTIGMSWSGETYLATQENPNLVYIYPQEGFSIWVDCLAIAANAPHYANAEKFLNFLMRPDIAKKLVLAEGYATPNLAAVKLLPAQLKDNPIMNPTPNILDRGKFQLDIGDAISTYQHYWELLKLGDSNGS